MILSLSLSLSLSHNFSLFQCLVPDFFLPVVGSLFTYSSLNTSTSNPRCFLFHSLDLSIVLFLSLIQSLSFFLLLKSLFSHAHSLSVTISLTSRWGLHSLSSFSLLSLAQFISVILSIILYMLP